MHYASKTAAAPRGIPAIVLHPPEFQWVFRSSAISCLNPKSGRAEGRNSARPHSSILQQSVVCLHCSVAKLHRGWKGQPGRGWVGSLTWPGMEAIRWAL